MRSAPIILAITLFALLFSPHLVTSQDNSIDTLVIHSGNGELQVVTSILSNQNAINLDSILISELETSNIENYEFIIFVSDVEFETDTVAESKLITHLNSAKTAFVSFSPFVEEFEDGLNEMLGISNSDKIFPEEEGNPTWTLSTTSTLGDIQSGTIFEYSGPVLTFEKTVNAQTMVEVTSGINTGEEEGEIDYPFPVIVDASNNDNLIITSTASIISTQNLLLLGLNELFEELVDQILLLAISSYDVLNPTIPTSDNGSPGFNLPGFFSIQILIILAIAILALFIGKFLGLFRWLGEKLIYLGIGIIGIFYNVQDRVLDDNDVLMNQQRSDILKYLDHVGASGAHMREIKNVLKSGTGSLLWHLQVLEDFNYISKVKIDKYTVFVSYDYMSSFSSRSKQIELQIQSKITIDVLEVFMENPSIVYDINILQEKTGIYRKAIRRFISKLEQVELIEVLNENPISFKLTDLSILEVVLKNLRLRETFVLEDNTDINITRME